MNTIKESELSFSSESTSELEESTKKPELFVVTIVPNGKPFSTSFTVIVTPEINSMKRFKEAIIYQQNIKNSNITLYNRKGIPADEADISLLYLEPLLFLAHENEPFNNENYINEFPFQSMITKGGFAEVYLAKNALTEEIVAVKKTNLTGYSADLLYNISRESVYLSTLHHKNIIKIYSSFLYKNALYIIMQYAKGGELTSFVQKGGLDEETCKKIFQQIHKAVNYIHKNNIIHRDLKPSNILFLDEEKTQIALIDFGISGISNGNSKEKVQAGTLKFVPPEIISGETFDSTTKVDTWALGVILYYMKFGKLPFEGKTGKDLKKAIMKCDVIFPKGAMFSKAFANLIFGLLKRSPTERIDCNSDLFKLWYEDDGKDLYKESVFHTGGLFDSHPEKLLRWGTQKNRKNESLKVKYSITGTKPNKKFSTNVNATPGYLRGTLSQKYRENKNPVFIKVDKS